EVGADVEGGEGEECARVGGGDFFQRAAQAEHGALEDVVGLLPLLQPAVGVKHLPRQPGQACTGGGQQLLAGGGVPGAEAVQALLHQQGGFLSHGETPDVVFRRSPPSLRSVYRAISAFSTKPEKFLSRERPVVRLVRVRGWQRGVCCLPAPARLSRSPSGLTWRKLPGRSS